MNTKYKAADFFVIDCTASPYWEDRHSEITIELNGQIIGHANWLQDIKTNEENYHGFIGGVAVTAADQDALTKQAAELFNRFDRLVNQPTNTGEK